MDFFPLVKLRRGVLNYITKHRRNGLSLGDQLYDVREETEVFPNPTIENP
jgi:hypothetical protein